MMGVVMPTAAAIRVAIGFRVAWKTDIVALSRSADQSAMTAKSNPARPAARRGGGDFRLDRALTDDLVAANRTLARLNVLDAFGHVSVRDPRQSHRYLISRSIAPESVTAADIVLLDLNSQTVDPKDDGKLLYRERFIHGEIYKARPDVNAVVHSHSPTVVPFTVTRAKLKPLLHNAGFLGLGAPLFEIRKSIGDGTDLMILTPELGKDLANKLGKEAAVVLMRGHGDSVVGPSLPNAVFRAYYTEINARQQLAAITIGGPINFMTRAEALTANEAMLRASARPWALWRKRALAED
jgi:HCOMODA/2-hydroxy-3-carboxy-muconic semialdehyde decarboxylase